ncbi:hypothetical protein A4W95_00654 [Treponema pallidum subsp. pallidum]|nr:hypothetical protein [Treponema pallidum]ANA42467.1 hypothetical protein A4W95_00654 [Treponema pallidum subsp. pallidum]AYE90072.1 hypothetical protein TPEKDK363_0783 [Treponema pallidum subsp. pertenue]QBC41826.1 hypothetical protein TENDIB_0783 [Treponema pallidum subsp. endemicum]AVW88786.1 hypothetical protein TPAUZ1974_0783 [Treponema pallidum subsp. pallidum]AYE91134.1 hypothetical protein TPESGK403_0783 [Treponema pallidum subsp. pertenue]
MKIKEKKGYFISFSALFLIAYMFVAAVPLGADPYFLPIWARDLASELHEERPERAVRVNADTVQTLQPFMVGEYFGYFTDEGSVVFATRVTQRLSASTHAWAVYPEHAVRTPVFNPAGEHLAEIAEPGFVHIEADRFFLFSPGGNAVSSYDARGVQRWRVLHTAPITAFHSSAAGAVIGFSDGKVMVVRADGTVRCAFYPGGSTYEIVFGVTLSADGTLAACVCGLDRQRVILVSLADVQCKIVHHQYLEGALRHQLLMNFDTEGRYVVFEHAQGVGVIDCQRLETNIIPLVGDVVGMGVQPECDVVTVLSQKEQRCRFAVFERAVHRVGDVRFDAQDVSLTQGEKKFFLSIDMLLARIDIAGIP